MTQELPAENQMPLESKVSETCSIRVLRPDDAQRIWEILQADPDISTKYVTWLAGVTSAEDIAERITEFIQKKSLRYAIVADDTLAGYIGATQPNFDDSSHEYQFGYLCDPAYRGRGLIPSSTQHLMDLLAQNMGAERFALYINDQNGSSQEVAKKLGYIHTEDVATDKVLGVDERRWEKINA